MLITASGYPIFARWHSWHSPARGRQASLRPAPVPLLRDGTGKQERGTACGMTRDVLAWRGANGACPLRPEMHGTKRPLQRATATSCAIRRAGGGRYRFKCNCNRAGGTPIESAAGRFSGPSAGATKTATYEIGCARGGGFGIRGGDWTRVRLTGAVHSAHLGLVSWWRRT